MIWTKVYSNIFAPKYVRYRCDEWCFAMTIAPQSVAPSSTVRAYEKDEVEMYLGLSVMVSAVPLGFDDPLGR